jgi:glycosyltransferase involved in cell wall biosynthesis
MNLLATPVALKSVVRALYYAARMRRSPLQRSGELPLRAVYISPAYFSDDSLIGGGERYATDLAAATAEYMEATLVSFGSERKSLKQGKLRIEVYPALRWMDGLNYDPLNYSFLRELVSADVVHCIQYRLTVTNLAILAGYALGKPVFVTDVGGVGVHFGGSFPIADFVERFLPISSFSATLLPSNQQSAPIYGGVKANMLGKPDVECARGSVLFVGRLLPHKGINFLIEAVREDMPLEIIGRVHDKNYFELLKQLSRGKQVRFITDASDEDLADAYQRALVTVLPSVYEDVYGTKYTMPELLGLVILEGMACGTPAICSDVGAMSEIVTDGVTGFVVPPNDPVAIRQRLELLFGDPGRAARMGAAGQERVRAEFTWDAVALRCLSEYRIQ